MPSEPKKITLWDMGFCLLAETSEAVSTRATRIKAKTITTFLNFMEYLLMSEPEFFGRSVPILVGRIQSYRWVFINAAPALYLRYETF
jgi:hypothetical protein